MLWPEGVMNVNSWSANKSANLHETVWDIFLQPVVTTPNFGIQVGGNIYSQPQVKQ